MPKASKSRRRKQNQSRSVNQEQQIATTEVQPRRRIQEMSPRMRTISLVVGDVLCFLIFASLGSNAHGKGVNLLNSVWIALPFLAAWFLVSPFVGAFRADIATSPSKMLVRTLLCWLAAWPVAMAFRWLAVERLNPVPPGSFLSFAIVVLLANTLLLVIWRWPFALNNRLRKSGV